MSFCALFNSLSLIYVSQLYQKHEILLVLWNNSAYSDVGVTQRVKVWKKEMESQRSDPSSAHLEHESWWTCENLLSSQRAWFTRGKRMVWSGKTTASERWCF
jgi:hypothetical protein